MATANGTLLLLLAVVYSALAGPAPSPVSGPSSGEPIQFIHACCSATLYPDVCFHSLYGLADTVHLDPVRLAWAATNLTLNQLQSMLARTKELRKECSIPEEAAALHDCAELLHDAEDLTRQSAAEIGLLGSAEGEGVRWHVSNAQTWLSAAMTNEDTCSDGMDEVAAGSTKDDISERVWQAKQFTSISLALINHLAT